MRKLIFALLFTTIAAPASLAQDKMLYAFKDAVSICINFGSDGWLAQDRLEELGWTSQYYVEYDTMAFYDPSKKVKAIPPAEGQELPTTCTVLGYEVPLAFAKSAALEILVNSGTQATLRLYEGCPALQTEMGQEVRIMNDGNEVLCNEPNTARIEVVTFKNPVANQ